MYEKIILGYNGTDLAGDGLELARHLAGAMDADLLIACVFSHHYPYLLAYDYEVERRAAESVLAQARAELGTDVRTRSRAVMAASAAAGLHDLAEQEQADLIVLGSSHRGALGRVLAGSVAVRLLHGSPCAVAVAPKGFRDHPHATRHRIAVGFDGAPESHAALAAAVELAQALDASIRVLAVFQPELIVGFGEFPPAYDRSEVIEDAKKHLERALGSALASLPAGIEADGSVLAGRPAEVLTHETSEGVDLLVTGSRGFGPLGRAVLGSVSAALMRSAACPVLVVPRAAMRASPEAAPPVAAEPEGV